MLLSTLTMYLKRLWKIKIHQYLNLTLTNLILLLIGCEPWPSFKKMLQMILRHSQRNGTSKLLNEYLISASKARWNSEAVKSNNGIYLHRTLHTTESFHINRSKSPPKMEICWLISSSQDLRVIARLQLRQEVGLCYLGCSTIFQNHPAVLQAMFRQINQSG